MFSQDALNLANANKTDPIVLILQQLKTFLPQIRYSFNAIQTNKLNNVGSDSGTIKIN